MPSNPDLSRLPISEFAEHFRSESIPLGHAFSYFVAGLQIAEDELKEYIEEPIAALPQAIRSALPPILILLVPYIERANGRGGAHREDIVAMERPQESRIVPAGRSQIKDTAVLAFGVKDCEMAEYHYNLYRSIAEVFAERIPDDAASGYAGLLREEFSGSVHGEVDERSWHLKQALMRRQGSIRRDSKPFRGYARQSVVDTLTLYLHGICCDIDVDTGPRQLPSRFLRKRLQMLQTLYPPPKGYAVFPEELSE